MHVSKHYHRLCIELISMINEEEVADDDTIEDENEEDTFQVEKHSHALNFTEAGEFIAWVRGELEELDRVVKRGKDMDVH